MEHELAHRRSGPNRACLDAVGAIGPDEAVLAGEVVRADHEPAVVMERGGVALVEPRETPTFSSPSRVRRTRLLTSGSRCQRTSRGRPSDGPVRSASNTRSFTTRSTTTFPSSLVALTG